MMNAVINTTVRYKSWVLNTGVHSGFLSLFLGGNFLAMVTRYSNVREYRTRKLADFTIHCKQSCRYA